MCRLSNASEDETDSKMAGMLTLRLLQAYHEEAGEPTSAGCWCNQSRLVHGHSLFFPSGLPLKCR
jgi:hypothetical protein